MTDDADFFRNASKRTDIDPDGMFDVIAHGNPTHIELNDATGVKLLDAKNAARFIRNAEGYTGQDIRLLSCSTGTKAKGFAQQLADELNVKVTAPNDTLWAHGNGRLTVGPIPDINSGKFVTFIPGEK